MRTDAPIAHPWYREPWPWLLMSGPAIVVVAGFFTMYLAVSGQDGLVVDDYYKQGKSINQSLHRDEVARQLGITALVNFDQVNDRVVLSLKHSATLSPPDTLTIGLVHATRSGFDRVITLSLVSEGYIGKLPPLGAGKWNVLLEDPQKQWRLQKEIVIDGKSIPPLQL
ncbi:MAG: FixH family protein [Pseudomonadota bacterium]